MCWGRGGSAVSQAEHKCSQAPRPAVQVTEAGRHIPLPSQGKKWNPRETGGARSHSPATSFDRRGNRSGRGSQACLEVSSQLGAPSTLQASRRPPFHIVPASPEATSSLSPWPHSMLDALPEEEPWRPGEGK